MARRAAAGEGIAMDELLGALWPVWYAVGLRCLRDPVLAEEAAQETAVRVLRGLRRFDFQSSVRTWSIRIVLNASTDQIRRDRRARAPLADVEPGADRSDPLTRLSVAQAVGRLSAEDARLIALRYDADLRYREIAELLHLPTSTVAARLQRILARLADLLDAQHAEIP